MRLALRLARRGRGRVSPNPLVGAVIVKDGVIVGKGYHRAYGMDHAEVVAIKDAGERSEGATIYVNLEPCNHKGHTPPCTRAILMAGIRRVVIGMRDPNPYVEGGGAETLRRNGVTVDEGVLEEKCRRLNETFIHFITRREPFVVMKIASTLDGKTATRTGCSQWITGRKSLRYVHRLRAEMDAVMVGIGTVLKDDPLLTCRLPHPPHQPLRIIVDTNLRIPEDSKLVTSIASAPLLVATGPEVDERKRKRLESLGVEILPVSIYNKKVDLRQLMAILSKRPITSVLLEGGSRLNASALASGVVQKVMIFYAPKILGGQRSKSMIGEPSPKSLDKAVPMASWKVRKVGEDFLFEGYLKVGERV